MLKLQVIYEYHFNQNMKTIMEFLIMELQAFMLGHKLFNLIAFI